MRGVLRLLLLMAALLAAPAARAQTGGEVYQARCASCHDSGVGGAPRVSEQADWTQRVGKGRPALIRSVIYGIPRTKAPRAGTSDLPDRDLTAAVDYMIHSVGLPVSSYSPPARIAE